MGTGVKNFRKIFSAAVSCAVLALVWFQPGCASTEGPTTRDAMAEHQADAIKDPMGYHVMEDHDISGGGISDFNKKGFDKDVNDFFNP